jgi:hypothetical protein
MVFIFFTIFGLGYPSVSLRYPFGISKAFVSHLLIHDVEHKSIERELFAVGGERSWIETRPLVVVDLGEYGLAQYGPCGVNG